MIKAPKKYGSSGIWSDKVSLLHIKVTQRVGEHGGESIKTISRRCRRHKERQSRSVRVSDSFGNKHGSSGFWSDKVCHLCLEFEVMSHGGTERTEDY